MLNVIYQVNAAAVAAVPALHVMQGSAVFGMGKADEESRFRATMEVKAYNKNLRETVGRNISASLNRISYSPLDFSFMMSIGGGAGGSGCFPRVPG